MTDEQLDALVNGLWGNEVTAEDIAEFCAAITTLRAQLAEALEWKRYWSGEMDVVLAGRADETDRADRAEAALAAQIEADAGIVIGMKGHGWDENPATHPYDKGYIGACDAAVNRIRNQPHDRTALDRYREKALREAAQACDWGDIYGDNAVRTILALIEKEKTK